MAIIIHPVKGFNPAIRFLSNKCKEGNQNYVIVSLFIKDIKKGV